MKNSQKGFSLSELIIVLAVIGIVAVATIPKPLASPNVTVESSAIASIRAIVTAQGIYRATVGAGSFAPSGAVLASAGLIDSQLGCAADSCVKNGYEFIIVRSANDPRAYFDVIAKPVFGSLDTQTRSFYANEAGVIYYGTHFTNPTANAITRHVSGGVPFQNMFPNKFDFWRYGRSDVATYRPSNGTWCLNQSRAGIKGFKFGISTDVPTPADYDGDGKADVAVFRNGTWHIQESGLDQLRSVQFGEPDDQPVASAYVR